MVPDKKILTVAYGTFSCTLEGFDDPFSTMTGIAEYFRDLAADDRFFGAEPPTPDMAMLRMIAETRAKQSVEAKPEDGGILLRPSAMPAADAVSAAFDAREAPADIAAMVLADKAEAVSEADAAEKDDVATEDRGDEIDTGQDDAPEADAVSAEADEDAVQADVADASDSVAAKLARIRGVVESDRQSSAVYAEDEHADDMMDNASYEDDGYDDAPMADDTLAAAFAADALDDLPTDADLEDEGSMEADGEDTMAADLAAILSSDLDKPAEIEPTEEAIEPAAPETVITEDSTPVEVAGSGTEADDRENDAQVEDDTDPSSGEEAEAAMPRRIRIRKIRRAEAAAKRAAEEDAAVVEATELEAEDASSVQAAPPEVAEDVAASDEDEGDELMAELAAIEAELTLDPINATGETAIPATEKAAKQNAADEDDDLMAELAAIRLDEGDDLTAEDENDDIVSSILGMDDEDDDADLVAALQDDDAEQDAVIKDSAPKHDDPVVEDAEEDLAHPVAENDPSSESGGDLLEDEEERAAVPSDPDMERLFAATDSRLSGEDTSRRHANISHLKAAVAARRADGPVETQDQDDTGAYRADLASTVRPRRKVPAEGRSTPRPERPAPLVLVSEQRVEDATPAAEPAPVQPRRAPRTAEMEVRNDALMGAEDFEAFAADVGASDLADILEAAAVYSAKVMGQDNFSRPRLLHLAAEAVDDLSREDGLRGFGQLLRDGTIRKVSRGTFALATDSRYSDQAERRAG